jgi:hypothetical protein
MTTDELRDLVREVLRDALPEVVAGAGAGPGSPGAAEAATVAEAAEVVPVGTDAELAALVRRVATECADPQRREALAAGRVRFALDRAVRTSAGPSVASYGQVEPEAVLRVERGAVTERQVRDAARRGVSIVAARGVVVTPLARDRARTSGVDIEKEH